MEDKVIDINNFRDVGCTTPRGAFEEQAYLNSYDAEFIKPEHRQAKNKLEEALALSVALNLVQFLIIAVLCYLWR